MSGGHWNYDDARLIGDLEEIFDDEMLNERVAGFAGYVKKILAVVKDTLHDLDWHLSDDKYIDDMQAFEAEACRKLRDCLEHKEMNKDEKTRYLKALSNLTDSPMNGFQYTSSFDDIFSHRHILLCFDKGGGKTRLSNMLKTKEGIDYLLKESNLVMDPKTIVIDGFCGADPGKLIKDYIGGLGNENPKWDVLTWWPLLLSIINNYPYDYDSRLSIDDRIIALSKIDIQDVNSWAPIANDLLTTIYNTVYHINELIAVDSFFMNVFYDMFDIFCAESIYSWVGADAITNRIPKCHSNIKAKVFVDRHCVEKFYDPHRNVEWNLNKLYTMSIKRVGSFCPEIMSLPYENAMAMIFSNTPSNLECRLKDANGAITPRVFLSFLSHAAEIELQNVSDSSKSLFSRSSFEAAIIETSKSTVKYLSDSWHWFRDIVNSGILVDFNFILIEEEDFISMLDHVNWSEITREYFEEEPAGEVFSLMLRYGIISRRETDRRLNMPDIYLYGFGAKRRGGLKKWT